MLCYGALKKKHPQLKVAMLRQGMHTCNNRKASRTTGTMTMVYSRPRDQQKSRATPYDGGKLNSGGSVRQWRVRERDEGINVMGMRASHADTGG